MKEIKPSGYFGRLCCVLGLLAFNASAEIEASNYTQSRVGEIHSMDFASRTAIISGYRYGFSGLNGYDTPSVKMLGSDAGAYELLQVGMRVNIVYRLSKYQRVVVSLQQVTSDAKLGVPDVEE